MKYPFEWSSKAQQVFTGLKDVLSIAPTLLLPDFIIPFSLETNVFGVDMGAVLSQKGHPIAFFSKPFTPKLLHASTYAWELFAITTAIKKWRQYLLGHHFIILIDHWSLKELMT